MPKGVNLGIHGFSFCFFSQCIKMLKISFKKSVAKCVLLNKVVCKTCHSVFWMENSANGILGHLHSHLSGHLRLGIGAV